MKVITDLSAIPPLSLPSALTIGSFDGIHLGHQKLFSHLREKVSSLGSVVVFTFSNHPSFVIPGRPPTRLLLTTEHKLKLLSDLGVDLTILVEFTSDFSKKPFDEFLTELKSKLKFSYLALGEGATFGKDKTGDASHVQTLAKQLHFHVDYLSKINVENTPISSGRIRTLVEKGQLNEVKDLLGRPYSILGQLEPNLDHYILKVHNLCLPPNGIYPIELLYNQKVVLGRAHIDQAHSIIRIDLFNSSLPPSKKTAEILFITTPSGSVKKVTFV